MIYDSESRRKIIEIDERLQALKADMLELEQIKRNLVFYHYRNNPQMLLLKRKKRVRAQEQK